MNKLNRTLYLFRKWFKKNLPTILTWTGAISTVGALCLTSRATVKAVRVYDQLKDENNKVDKKVFIKKVIPYYIPAAGFAASSIVCTFSSNHINLKRQRVLSGALFASNEALSAFKKKVEEKIGKEETKQITEECKREINDRKAVTYLSDEIIKVYDSFMNYTFETTMTNLIDAETNVNRILNNPAWSLGIVPYDVFYSWLKVTPPKGAELYTWHEYEMSTGYECTWVDFYHEDTFDSDGNRLIKLYFTIDPELDTSRTKTKDN